MDSIPASHAGAQGSNPMLTSFLPDKRNFEFFVHFDQFLIYKFNFSKFQVWNERSDCTSLCHKVQFE